MSKISVIIPVYNGEKYIQAALESVVKQRYRDVEVIVIDDGSTDRTAHIVQRFAEVRYVYQANAGVSAARNKGAAIATGDWLAFLDADDLWHPEKLTAQMAAVKNMPACDLVRAQVTDQLAQLQQTPIVYQAGQPPITTYQSLAPSFQNPYFSTSAVIVRRSAFDRVGGFDSRLKIAEDIDFYLKVLLDHPQVICVEWPLVYKRPVVGSLGDDSVAGYQKLLQVYQALLVRHPQVAHQYPAMVRKTFHDLYVRYAGSLYRREQVTEARQAVLQSFSYGFSKAAMRVLINTLLPVSLRTALRAWRSPSS